jgi:hypothetical protein
MIIKSFKIFESRSSELSESEFKKILNSQCKDFVSSPKLLQRSKTTKSPRFSFIDPSKFNRDPLFLSKDVSAGSKHHQLLMDNLPSWSDFPKRSKSIIGMTGHTYGYSYGTHRYFIIPFDGAEFGVSPDEDLWATHCFISDDGGEIGIDQHITFDDTFASMMKSRNISDKSYFDMINDLEKLSTEYKNKDNDINPFEETLNEFILKLNKFNSIEEGLDYYLNPSKFIGRKNRFSGDIYKGFKLMDYKKLSRLDKEYKLEFWTNSPCLLYYIGNIDFQLYSTLIQDAWEDFVKEFL